MKKVNRNDPCPCGSGKKYKKCCGNKKSSHLEGLTPGMRMKGGVKFDESVNAFVPIVHSWNNVVCEGEPNEWRSPEFFISEDEAMDYYKTYIRPELERLMSNFKKNYSKGNFVRTKLEE